MTSSVKKLIALDLDGTCARYEPRLEIDPVLIDYFRSLNGDGVRWVINSDRYADTLFDVAKRLPAAQRPVAILSLQRFIYLAHDSGEYVSFEAWNNRQNSLHEALWQRITPYFDQWQQAVESRFSVLDSVVNDIVFAYMVHSQDIEKLREMMNDFLTPFPEAQVSGNHDWSFMLHRSFSKATLLKAAAEYFKVNRENLIAVGDGLNDISMLCGEVTPNVGCPVNASSEVIAAVQKAGGVLAAGESALGTLEVIRHYLEQ